MFDTMQKAVISAEYDKAWEAIRRGKKHKAQFWCLLYGTLGGIYALMTASPETISELDYIAMPQPDAISDLMDEVWERYYEAKNPEDEPIAQEQFRSTNIGGFEWPTI